MSRLEILVLIGIACAIVLFLSKDMRVEGLSKKKQPNKEKSSTDIPAPDEYLDRDSREHTSGDSLLHSQVLKTMTPLSLTQREVDADHEYRWVADEWPKCKERCAYRPIHRQVKCFRRNAKPYSDDIPMDDLFTEPAFEKDELGHTVCDKERSGININVKPSESTFCSLLNNCTPSIHKVMKHPKPIALEKTQMYDRQSIGFSVLEMQMLSDDQQRVLRAAFPEIRSIQIVSGPKGSIPNTGKYRYSTIKSIKLHISSLTETDKNTLSSALQSIRVRTHAEKTFDIGSLVFSSIGVSI